MAEPELKSHEDLLKIIKDNYAIALVPPIYSLILHGDHIDVVCNSMMATAYGFDETIIITGNPVWKALWEYDENAFMEWVIKGISHETIHGTLNRMNKPITSKQFDSFSGTMDNIDDTGVITYENSKKWQRRLRARRRHRTLK